MDSSQNDIDVRNQEFEKGRSWAMGAAMLVYIGVVLAATCSYLLEKSWWIPLSSTVGIS